MRSLSIPFICCGVLFALSVGGHCLTVDTVWTNNFWVRTWDSANCIQETSDGGFIIAGETRDDYIADSDILLIKTDQYGQLDWSVAIGDTFPECGYHVFETFDGGYMISASSYKYGDGSGAAWFIKTDASGDTLWTYPFAPEGRNGFPLFGIQRADSGFAFTGLVNLPGVFNDSYILLLDKDGAFEGYEHWGGYAYQDGQFITEMPDSGFIIAGTTNDPYSTNNDFRAIRVDKNLAVMWDSTYALTEYDELVYGACKAPDGIVIVGTNRNNSHAHKIDFDGNTIWSVSISKMPTYESPNSICPTADGGYMVGGWVGGFGNYRDYIFTKLDASGDTVWTHMVGGPQDDLGQSLVVTSDGGYAMVGTSYSWVSGTSLYLVKVREFNTSAGANVEVQLSDEVTITFDNVTEYGETEVAVSAIGPALPTSLQVVPSEPPTYYDITSSAAFDGYVEITITYDEADIAGSEENLSLMHFDGVEWTDITTALDTDANTISGTTLSLSPFVIAEPFPVDVGEAGESLPVAFDLGRNYPNPFNPTTTITYSLAQASHVKLEVFTVLGQRVAALVNEPKQSGVHSIVWDGTDNSGNAVASGIYIYRIVADNYIASRKMQLVR